MTVLVYMCKRLEYPLKAYVDETNFRMYMTDIGMLIGTYEYSLKQAVLKENTLEEKSMNLLLGTAKGGLFEALAADMLYKSGYRDVYYIKDIKSTYEIEFIIADGEGILPIEVKAGKKKANSLDAIRIVQTQFHILPKDGKLEFYRL